MSEPTRSNFLPKWARDGRWEMGEFPDIGAADEEDQVGEQPKATMREAAGSLYDSFGIDRGPDMHPYIQAIGEAETTGLIWVLLVRKPRSCERQIPEEWEGWPVKTTVVGRFVIN